MKTANVLWCFSFISIGICTVLLAGANLVRMDLPDVLVRIAGLIDAAALPVLGYTTVKKWKNKQP